MNKKAFTLVELLAVIVVLAIILIIAVPRVMNTIEESRKESFRITGEQLLDGAENKSASDAITSIEDKIYTIANGAFVGDSFSITGELPDNGTIVVEQDGNTSIAALKGEYCIKKDLGEENVSISKDPECGILVPTPEICFSVWKNDEWTNGGIGVTITDYDDSCSKDVIIPSTLDSEPVTNIGGYAFSNNQLTSVIIPTSVIKISGEAFQYNQLASVIIPNSVTSLGGWAFSYNQLTSVTIPTSITSIGYGVFYSNQFTSVTIPTSVTSIEWVAFSENQLTSVTIPNSVTSIGEAAFRYNQLTSVTIPVSVTSIDLFAFYDNYLTSVTIPNSVTSIGEAAFGYNLLTSIIMPANVTIINDSVSPTFYTSYVTNNARAVGTYTAPSQEGVWTKQ